MKHDSTQRLTNDTQHVSTQESRNTICNSGAPDFVPFLFSAKKVIGAGSVLSGVRSLPSHYSRKVVFDLVLFMQI